MSETLTKLDNLNKKC